MACIVISQIVTLVASNQYGEVSVDLKHLGKYLRKSKEKFKKEFEADFDKKTAEKIVQKMYEKELKAGVQSIIYQMATIINTTGQVPVSQFLLHIDSKDEYIEENAKIIEEILNQIYYENKNDIGSYNFPKFVYVLDEMNSLQGGKYDYLTELAIKCSINGCNLSYLSAKKMRENYEGNVYCPCGYGKFLKPWKDDSGNFKFEGRFNQGIVSINLPQIGINVDCDEVKFWEELDERLELCKEALMCRFYALLGTTFDISPLHFQYGAISRMENKEKIDKLLYGGYSNIYLGYVGVNEITKLIKGVDIVTKERTCICIKNC